MAKSHLHFLSVNRFVDRDALMRHFGHGIGHLEYGHMHETPSQPNTRDEDREEVEQDPEYQDGEEEDHELMDVDGNRDDEEEGTTLTDESSDSGDDSDDSENSDESGYASF